MQVYTKQHIKAGYLFWSWTSNLFAISENYPYIHRVEYGGSF